MTKRLLNYRAKSNLMKALKIIVIVVIALVAIGVIGLNIIKTQTKKHSPEVHTSKTIDQTQVGIVYSSPSKKGRIIFGDLVPYGKVWRTGANEATVFSTTKDLKIAGKVLKAGEYSLWTIPNADSWEVIFNSEIPGWGVDFDTQAQQESEFDVLRAEFPVETTDMVKESFEIAIDEEPSALCFSWDNVRVNVPFTVKP